MGTLPTREEMFARADAKLDQAYRALGDAADELRSDWTPAGSPLTGEPAARRSRLRAGIGAAKAAINQAKDRGDPSHAA